MTSPQLLRFRGLRSLLFLLCAAAVLAAPARFDIPAQSAADALSLFVKQSGVKVLFLYDEVKNVRTNAITGELDSDAALASLLNGTGLQSTKNAEGKFTVGLKPVSDPNAPRAAPTSDRPTEKSAKTDDKPLELPEVKVLGKFEVMESKLLNMDKPRTIDDPQPYVVFDRAVIEQSGALDVNDFLKTRLSMNAEAQTAITNPSQNIGSVSAVNLRGLGVGQTLILIDGHRMAAATNANSPFQTDLNSIPVAAIERIEVLPSTASGIYGGSATGGVVNVILRRDYAGLDVKLGYQNTFSTDAAIRSFDFAAGFTLEGGKTNVLVSGNYSDQNELMNQDRDFTRRGRAAVLQNNPGYYASLTTQMPLGSTPNIRSTNGSNLILKKNNTPLNSFFTFVPKGYAGIATDGGSALVANAGRYNLELAQNAQAVTVGSGAFLPLAHVPTRRSLNFSVRRQFAPWLQGFLEASGADVWVEERYNTSLNNAISLPATAASNPFTTAVLVEVPDDSSGDGVYRTRNQSRHAVAGFIAQLPASWKAESDFTWSTTRQVIFNPGRVSAAGLAALASGSIDLLRDGTQFPLNLTGANRDPFNLATGSKPYGSIARDVSLRFSGPVGSLPGGEPTLSTSFEYRVEDLHDAISVTPTSSSYAPSRTQSDSSGYVELLTPLIGAPNRKPFAQALDLQLAGRFDHYTTRSSTGSVRVGSENTIVRTTSAIDSTNPTIALRYQPVADLSLRASYGKGFFPPSVDQLVAFTPSTSTSIQTDPRRGNENVSGIALLSGGNPALRPEKSQSTSIGLILTPHVLSGLRVSVDYTRIKKSDNISTLNTQQIIDNETIFPGRITRGPNKATDPVGWAGPITAVDSTFVNVSATTVEAYDLRLDYSLKAGAHDAVDFFAGATRTTHFQTQLIPSSPVVENVGYTPGSFTAAFNSPPRLKVIGGIAWKRKSLTLGWNLNYVSSYYNYAASDSVATRTPKILNQGNPDGVVPGQIYHDLFASFRFNESPGSRWAWLWGRTEIQLGIKNLFNAEPPFDATNTAYYYSYYGDPRLRSYYLNVRKSF